MRVLVATTAGAGHLAGLLPFARACVELGHEVRVAAPASFAASVQGAGFVHAPVADVDPARLGAVFGGLGSVPRAQANLVVLQDVFGRLDLQAALPGMQDEVASWRPDVVLREPAELASYVVAERLGVPHVQANIGLCSFDDRLLPLLDDPLAEVGCPGGSAGLRRAPRWTVVPATFDEAAVECTGPLTRARDPLAGPAAAPPLPDWWPGADDPLLYVSFGSVAAAVGLFPGLYARVVAALGELPVRVLLTLGEAGAPAALGPLPGNVHVERWWPQGEVLAHASAVVTHGGFGTTFAALALGVPQVVVPLFAADQFDNARRVAATGVGVALVDDGASERPAGETMARGPDAVEGLAEAVVRVLDDPGARQAARSLADEMAALPSAVQVAESLSALSG